MHNTKERVADATSHVRPYVERAIRDEELRRNVKDAYTSARALYEQLLAKNDVSHVATKLVSDEDVQTELRNVIAKLRSAAGRVHSAQEETKTESQHSARSLVLFAGIAIGLLVNPLTGPKLRGWLKKKLFSSGKGDDFVYHDGNGTHLN